jgi:cell division protein FtsB
MTGTKPTPEDIARWRALARSATQGPWRAGSVELDAVLCLNFEPDALAHERVLLRLNKHFARNHEDGAFIAAAREAVPRLCDRVAGLQDAIDRAAEWRQEQVRRAAALEAENVKLRAEVERLSGGASALADMMPLGGSDPAG